MCLILYTEIDGKKILAKNRDGKHIPRIEIIHEIVNNIEIVYLKDKTTGWIEGMNEYGTGIVNSTLNEKAGKLKGSLRKRENVSRNHKTHAIHNLLFQPNNKKSYLDYVRKNARFLEGHSLLILNDELYHLEKKYNEPESFIIEKAKGPSVYTNHGIKIKKAGNTRCIKGISSFLRRKIMQTELERQHSIHGQHGLHGQRSQRSLHSMEDVLNLMNQNYVNIDPRFHPYRDIRLSKKSSSTSGQLLLNITDKEFIYYTDVNNSRKVTYINKLPKTYNPKLRVIIKETEKQRQNKKRLFTQKYITSLHKKFPCASKTGKKTKKVTKGSTHSKTRRSVSLNPLS